MFRCKICGNSFQDVDLLQKHLKRHPKTAMIKLIMSLCCDANDNLIHEEEQKQFDDDDLDLEVKEEAPEMSTTSTSSSMQSEEPPPQSIKAPRRSTRIKTVTSRYSIEGTCCNNNTTTNKLTTNKEASLNCSSMYGGGEQQQQHQKRRLPSYESFLAHIEQMKNSHHSDTDTCSISNSPPQTNDNLFSSGGGLECGDEYYPALTGNSGYSVQFNTVYVYLYVCHFCYLEYSSIEGIRKHISLHLEQQVLDDVLDMEKDYAINRTRLNILFNFYSAGFHYGKTYFNNFSVDFYNVFLSYATSIQDGLDRNIRFSCKHCGFIFFDQTIFNYHVAMAHKEN